MNQLYKKRTKTTGHTLGNGQYMVVKLRHDDECNNGHNTFSITGELWESERKYYNNGNDGREKGLISCGCIHEDIMIYFKVTYGPLIKWHLVSDDGPMHYVANTLYHLGYQNNPTPNLGHARSSAVWPDMPESFLCDLEEWTWSTAGNAAAKVIETALLERLPALMLEFHAAMAAIKWDVSVPK